MTLGRVDQEIGKRANTSHETVRKVETILEQGDKDLIDKTRSGKTSINYAYKTVKRANDHKNVPELPRDRFDIILADPPWSYDINTRGSPDDHYNVMSDSDISKLQIPVSDNAILFLWATNPKLKEALSVMSAWGFNYKTNAVWVKDKIGTGYYFRGQHELLLVGEKGDMPLPEEKNRVASVIEAPRGKHSEKPDKVYDIIESMYPGRKYFELFSRGKARKNWTMWGNEVNNKNE